MDVRAALVGLSGRELDGLRYEQSDRIRPCLSGWRLRLQRQSDRDHCPGRRELQVLVRELLRSSLLRWAALTGGPFSCRQELGSPKRFIPDQRDKDQSQRNADDEKSNAKIKLRVVHGLTSYLDFPSDFWKVAWTA